MDVAKHKIEEGDGPGKFYLGDNRMEHIEEDEEMFSESDISVITAPDGQGIMHYANKTEPEKTEL